MKSRGRSPALIFADARPRIKPFLRPGGPNRGTCRLLVGLIASFRGHHGRLSAAKDQVLTTDSEIAFLSLVSGGCERGEKTAGQNA